MTDPPAEVQGSEAPPDSDAGAEPYRVLARKYRPADFEDLIGQEALVRTLTNAIESDRLAQAYILTGVRGVGKTTTARIIARALNCIGPDGTGGATARPCGVCANCAAIAADRHVDVIEMDAASRTGIDDIRDLIESVRYRPVQARRKVYIIDEVHMLSKSAFNALLKTLEEPPEHVVFLFATTEVRKVPVTVLSRCQRFDLRRVDQDLLAQHFATICAREDVAADPEALALISRAADGSVRDGLSLLDQAIALAAGDKVTGEQVHAMLGLADRTRIFDLYDDLMAGRAADALDLLRQLYDAGADPLVVLQDLLELTHLLTRAKLIPQTLESEPEAERRSGGAMAEALGIPSLTRNWQILLKGLEETRGAPFPLQAAEMVLIRLIHASRLPPPGALVRQLTEGAAAPTGSAEASPSLPLGTPSASADPAPEPAPPAKPQPEPSAVPEASAPAAAEPPPEASVSTAPVEAPVAPELHSLRDIVALARARKEMSLANHLLKDVHLVHLEPGRLEFRPDSRAPAKLASLLSQFLQEATGARWMVSVSGEDGAPSLFEQDQAEEAEKRAAMMAHPLVQATLETFPGARLVARRDKPGRGDPENPDRENPDQGDPDQGDPDQTGSNPARAGAAAAGERDDRT